MEFSFFKGAVWQLIKQMDWIAIGILIALLCISVLCIAVIAFKYTLFRRHHKHLALLTKRLRGVRSMRDLESASTEFSDGIGGAFLAKNIASLNNILNDNPNKDHLVLTTAEFEIIEDNVSQNLDNTVMNEESYLPFLGTNAAAAPLIGLFGTIWGLIHAFIDISQEKSADITTVAPGMAEALIVTLAGLIVAIPAMIAFHYFSHEIRKMDGLLNAIGSTFLNTVKKTFIK